jgi:hypothetical protein
VPVKLKSTRAPRADFQASGLAIRWSITELCYFGGGGGRSELNISTAASHLSSGCLRTIVTNLPESLTGQIHSLAVADCSPEVDISEDNQQGVAK